MLHWIYETFLTPRRFPVTISVIFAIFVLCNPGLLQRLLLDLERELAPVLVVGLQMALIVGGIALILRKALGVGGGKRRR